MSPLNEADTGAKLIDPKIKAAGWGESQIEREHYFVKGRAITKGRIKRFGAAEALRRTVQAMQEKLYSKEATSCGR
jgi:type I restriction enzyme R subunit